MKIIERSTYLKRLIHLQGTLDFKIITGHNEVMLHRTFLTFGSGYYVDENGKSYWVILFSTHPYLENLRQN